ncbi:MAG: TRAP transporter large permease [Zetaproteobacteria bacterium]|nr:MAG: TRAP transporter large permease [Zetaproteobacteria bacterium]
MPLPLFFLCLALMLVGGFPIYLSLVGASLLYIALHPELSLLLAVQRMVGAPDSFALLAVPFFILAGQIMNTGGVTHRIFKFARCLVGNFRGGLGYVNVLASVIFAGMSGSALADAGGLGLVEIKAMRDEGYDDDFAIGVTAASSTIGPIIPPSIRFVIFGAVANVSVAGLFIGGFIPGLIMAAALAVMVFVVARRRNYAVRRRASAGDLWASFKESFLALLMPAILLGGIWLGVFTPTEAALVCILYAVVVTGLCYRELSVGQLPGMMVETIRMVVPAMMIVAGASLFGWIMNYEKVDQALVKLLLGITTNKYVLLLIVNLILLVLGMFLEVISVIMLVLPILQPLVTILGIHPIHLGVVVVLNLMIGLLTPPVGFVLYVLSGTTNRSFGFVVRAVVPWIIPLLVVLVLITLIPDLVMFLPRLTGFA